MVEIEGGLFSIGSQTNDFAWDNEKPAHQVFTKDFAIDRALVSNGDYLAFIRDGGYKRPEFWLSDGWSTVVREGWTRPIYWSEALDCEFTLHGLQPLHSATPVSHISYYEADAYARWAEARLPSPKRTSAGAGAGLAA